MISDMAVATNVVHSDENRDVNKTMSEQIERQRLSLAQVESIVIPRTPNVIRHRKQLDIDLVLENTPATRSESIVGLIDSGATRSVIDEGYALSIGLDKKQLERPIQAKNADGSIHRNGLITHYVEVRLLIQDHSEMILLPCATLGSSKFF